MARKACHIKDPRERIIYELSRIISMRDTTGAKIKMDALRAFARIHGLAEILGEPPNDPVSPVADSAAPAVESPAVELSFEERLKARLGPEEKKG